MKKKKNKFAYAEDARRKEEIARYGKIVSLRPSVTHKSKKTYDRKENKKETLRQLDVSYFFVFFMVLLYLSIKNKQTK